MMTRPAVRWWVALLLLCMAASVSGADGRRYPLADRGAIVLAVPDGWREEVRRPRPDLPPTIVYFSSPLEAFRVLITPLWPKNPDAPKPPVDAVRESVRQAADSVKSQAVETSIKIEELKGSQAHGFYFSVTDRAPKPGEYKYMTQGVMGLADLRVTFTILTNDGGESAVLKALDMLQGARREGAGAVAR